MIHSVAQKNISKEEKIIIAAKDVFFKNGFKKSKMEMIAKKAGCSKVTIYNYFESKENLYMAITYDALQLLINEYYKTVEKTKNKTGLHSLLELAETFIRFCTEDVDNAMLISNYRRLVQQAINNEFDRNNNAMLSSNYYRRIRGIQLLPINIIVDEIIRGQEDGSIKKDINPWLIHHMMWANVSAFMILPLRNRPSHYLNVELKEWKNFVLQTVEGIATGKI